ncbi:MAG: hypothetical protein SGCHY_002713, partial [Lobulomycetales sp.]
MPSAYAACLMERAREACFSRSFISTARAFATILGKLRSAEIKRRRTVAWNDISRFDHCSSKHGRYLPTTASAASSSELALSTGMQEVPECRVVMSGISASQQQQDTSSTGSPVTSTAYKLLSDLVAAVEDLKRDSASPDETQSNKGHSPDGTQSRQGHSPDGTQSHQGFSPDETQSHQGHHSSAPEETLVKLENILEGYNDLLRLLQSDLGDSRYRETLAQALIDVGILPANDGQQEKENGKRISAGTKVSDKSLQAGHDISDTSLQAAHDISDKSLQAAHDSQVGGSSDAQESSEEEVKILRARVSQLEKRNVCQMKCPNLLPSTLMQHELSTLLAEASSSSQNSSITSENLLQQQREQLDRTARQQQHLETMLSRLIVLFEGQVSQDSFSDLLAPAMVFEEAGLPTNELVASFISALQDWSLSLYNRVDELSTRLEERASELSSADLRVGKLELEIRHYMVEKEDLRARVSSLEDQLKAAHSECQQITSNTDKLTGELESATSLAQSLQTKYNSVLERERVLKLALVKSDQQRGSQNGDLAETLKTLLFQFHGRINLLSSCLQRILEFVHGLSGQEFDGIPTTDPVNLDALVNEAAAGDTANHDPHSGGLRRLVLGCEEIVEDVGAETLRKSVDNAITILETSALRYHVSISWYVS